MLFPSSPYIVCLNNGTIVIRYINKATNNTITLSERKNTESGESTVIERTDVRYVAEIVGLIRTL